VHTDHVWFRIALGVAAIQGSSALLRDFSVSSPPTPKIQEYAEARCTPFPSLRASVPFGSLWCRVTLCNYTSAVGKSEFAYNAWKEELRSRVEDPAYNTNTAHLPDEITQAVQSEIYCVCNGEYHYNYDRPRCLWPYHQRTTSQPRESPLSSSVSAKQPEGRDPKANRQSAYTVRLACCTQHYLPHWS
jgi:hypothetical protein